MEESFTYRARRVINGAFGGEHHVFSLKWKDDSCTFLVINGISTYDFAELTKLVVHCHDECIRGEITNGGPSRLKITLSRRLRKSVHPDSGAHPTLEQHADQIRNGGNYQPLFNLLRADPSDETKG